MKAYLYVPFQQNPAVLGKVAKNHVDNVSLNCVPPDLPSDWYRDPRLKVYSGYWVDDDLLSIGMTVRGGVDHEGRENPLSHVVLSDESPFLINPISSMVTLSKFVTDGTDVNLTALESIMASPSAYLESEQTLTKLVNDFGREFVMESVSALLKHPVTYVFYDVTKPMDFLNYVRLAYIIAGPLLGRKLSFVSTVDNFSGDAIWTLIRGYPVEDEDFKIQKDEKKQVDKQKAALVSMRKKEMITKSKSAKSVELILDELLDTPWFGMNRSSHFAAVREVLRGRGSKDDGALARIDKLRALKDD